MTLRNMGFLAGMSIIASLVAGTIGANANDSVNNAVADPNQWAVAGHDYGNTRYSPLKQINIENAGKLSLVYSFSLASLRSNESSPVVIGKTLYDKTAVPVQLIITDKEPVLDLRLRVETPVAWLANPTDPLAVAMASRRK